MREPLGSRIRESVSRCLKLEVIRGGEQSELTLPGYLTDTDDFNDQPSPYNFVCPTGRYGSCFANSYRVGAQFLLLLKKLSSGEPTVNWYALGSTNEQLYSSSDPGSSGSEARFTSKLPEIASNC